MPKHNTHTRARARTHTHTHTLTHTRTLTHAHNITESSNVLRKLRRNVEERRSGTHAKEALYKSLVTTKRDRILKCADLSAFAIVVANPFARLHRSSTRRLQQLLQLLQQPRPWRQNPLRHG